MYATTGSCVDFLEAWLNLAEKLVNASVILDSSHALPVPPPSQANGKKLLFSPLFNPLAFIIQAQKVQGGLHINVFALFFVRHLQFLFSYFFYSLFPPHSSFLLHLIPYPSICLQLCIPLLLFSLHLFPHLHSSSSPLPTS